MTGPNRAASVRQKLTNRSKQRGEDFQLLLLRYANDRILYRLSLSPFRDRFVLKGATLFSIWSNELHRVTRDVDLLGAGAVDEAFLSEVFQSVLMAEVDDGLTFNPESLAVAPIRKGQRYGGLRVTLLAKLGSARINLQIDVGLGDTHGGHFVEVPPVLDMPPARLKAYDRETVVAEKLEAAVSLGTANSRMKDFYDIATLAGDYSFEGCAVVRAIAETFERRETSLPAGGLAVLLDELGREPSTSLQWRAFLKKAAPRKRWTLAETLGAVISFAEEPLQSLASRTAFQKVWQPGGPWIEESRHD